MLEYSLKRKSNSRSITITIKPGGDVTVTAHPFVPKTFIDNFVISKRDWIEKHLHKLQSLPTTLSKVEEKKRYLHFKKPAEKLAHDRLAYFNKVYGFTYHKVTIRNTTSRWGSCTRSGNLSFSYKIALLPQVMADYIIVHELCHLGEFNHSSKFWSLVAITYPDYKKISKQLRLQ